MTIAKEPQDVFWGGYHAYFCNLDGILLGSGFGTRF
ncbi:hypothetical protein [Leptotrichia shahii]